MSIKEQIINAIQEKGGELIQVLLSDLKIKSFHDIDVEIGNTIIKPPTINIKTDKFKIKLIDKSTGKAISDIPIPMDIEIDIPEIKISVPTIKIDPKIDIMLGNKK
jgi:hypothetical protein